jgi:hypothetical protein
VCPITVVHNLKGITGQYYVVATILQDNSKIAATCPCNRNFNNFLNGYKTLSQNIVPQKDGCIHNETKERKRSAGHGNETAWEHKI